MLNRLVMFLSFCLVLGLALPLRAASPEAAAEPGYLHLRQGVTLYIANPAGEPFDIAIDLKDINTYCQGAQTALVKLYAPDGSTLADTELPDDGITAGGYDQAWAGWDHEQWALGATRDLGAEPLFRSDAFSDPKKLDKIRGTAWTHKIANAGKGVYQLQVVGCDDHFARIAVTRAGDGKPLKFGVLGHPDFLAGRDAQLQTSYLYVPPQPWYVKSWGGLDLWIIEHTYPRTRKLTLYHNGKPLEARDIAYKRSVTTMTPGQAMGRYELSLQGIAPGSVLKLVNEGSGDFLLRVHGIPAIFCPDEETARLIAGGIIAIPNGPAVSFSWQAQLWDAVKNLKREDLTLPPSTWNKLAPEDVKKLQIHQWETVNDPLQVDATIKAAQAALAKIEPFDMLKVLEDPALTGVVGETFYLYPIQGNGLYQNPALRNLLTLRLIKQWLRYRAGEVIWERGELNIAYAQGFHWNNWEPVYTLKGSLDPAVLRAFQRGALNIAQRMYYANGLELVLSNGRTTIPMNLHHAYLITGDERLKALSMRYLRRMVTALDGPHSGGSGAGYFREHFAADGGYCTYPLFQLGRMWNLSRDPEVFDAMDRLCKWVNYVTLPDGKGGYTGPTSWHARIAMGAIEHVWGEGYKYVAGKSQWAANMYHMLRPGKENYDVGDPSYEPGKTVPGDNVLVLTNLTRGVLPATPLPCESEKPFFENLGGADEFFAARRGNYYALMYAGKRAPFWMDSTLGGQSSFNGGGIAGLSIKGSGAVLLGRVHKEYGWPIESWNTLAVPAVVGALSDGRIFNTGVGRNTPAFDRENWTLTTRGECLTAPVNFERRYQFNEGSIAAKVVITDADLDKDVFQYRAYFRKPKVGVAFAWELLPFVADAATKVTAMDAAGASLGAVGENAIENVSVVEINTGHGGVRVKLDKPRAVKLSAKAETEPAFSDAGHARDGRSRAVQIKVSGPQAPGGSAEISYELIGFGK